jgi:hypothetical protein
VRTDGVLGVLRPLEYEVGAVFVESSGQLAGLLSAFGAVAMSVLLEIAAWFDATATPSWFGADSGARFAQVCTTMKYYDKMLQ